MAKIEKDAYYFPHFSNARHDRKLRRVQKELGIEGYGIYFMLLEVLRDAPGMKYPLDDIDLLADEFGTSEQKVRTVLCNYGLFDTDENNLIYSQNLIMYLGPYFERKEHARIAAQTRWHGKSTDARALPEQCDSNASKVKESKVNKSKEESSKKSIHPITGYPIGETAYSQLVEKYGQATTDDYCERVADYEASGKGKYKDHAATARNWIKRDVDAGKFKRSTAVQDDVIVFERGSINRIPEEE